jgi:outer membrane protein assembly factor BamB
MAHRESKAEIVREYGPFDAVESVAGVTYDGESVWFAAGESLRRVEPNSGVVTRRLDVPADAGTAFDGRHLYQLGGDRIRKLDPETGTVLATLPAPAGEQHSGMAWAEGKLWVAHYTTKRIYQVDPESGAILRTLETSRPVTGVTFVDGELWHGTSDGDGSDIRRIDAETGEVYETLTMPEGTSVSGLESDGRDLFYCGGGRSGKVRAVRRPKRG